MDTISPVPVHTPLYVGAYFMARLCDRLFYYPGSPVHVLSFFPVILLESFLMYFFAGEGPLMAGAPVLHILAAGIMNYMFFLVMLAVFRKRDRAVMFKMR